jgi:hypothetical protein
MTAAIFNLNHPADTGIRDLPRRVPIYKLIWRDHYRSRLADGT